MKVAVACCLSVLAAGLTAQQSRLEQRAIEATRQTRVSRLESGLPNQTLDKFTQVVGPDAAINWEVNDCGERTGNPQIDRARDLPICVAATANLADGRVVDVVI